MSTQVEWWSSMPHRKLHRYRLKITIPGLCGRDFTLRSTIKGKLQNSYIYTECVRSNEHHGVQPHSSVTERTKCPCTTCYAMLAGKLYTLVKEADLRVKTRLENKHVGRRKP